MRQATMLAFGEATGLTQRGFGLPIGSPIGKLH